MTLLYKLLLLLLSYDTNFHYIEKSFLARGRSFEVLLLHFAISLRVNLHKRKTRIQRKLKSRLSVNHLATCSVKTDLRVIRLLVSYPPCCWPVSSSLHFLVSLSQSCFVSLATRNDILIYGLRVIVTGVCCRKVVIWYICPRSYFSWKSTCIAVIGMNIN